MISVVTRISPSVYRWLTLGWTLIVLYATLGERPVEPPNIPFGDKIIHASLFMIWAFFLSLCFKKHPFTEFLTLSIVILSGMLLGFMTEYLQAYMPGRSPDPVDFIVDVIGMGFGLIFTFIIKKNE